MRKSIALLAFASLIVVICTLANEAVAAEQDYESFFYEQTGIICSKVESIVNKNEASKSDLTELALDVDRIVTDLVQKDNELAQEISRQKGFYDKFNESKLNPAIDQRIRNQYGEYSKIIEKKLGILYGLRIIYSDAYILKNLQRSLPQQIEVIKEVEKNNLLRMDKSGMIKEMLGVHAKELAKLKKKAQE
jgi:hypothetical protein